MQKNILNIIAVALTISTVANAGPKGLINTLVPDEYKRLGSIAALHKMSNSGLTFYRNFKGLAKAGEISASIPGKFAVSREFDSESFTRILKPELNENRHTLLVQTMETSKNGEINVSAFKLPETTLVPEEVYVSAAEGETLIKRLFKAPGGEIYVKQNVGTKEIENRNFRFVSDFGIIHQHKQYELSLLDQNKPNPRSVSVRFYKLEKEDELEMKKAFNTSIRTHGVGKIDLPDDVKGEIVNMKVSPVGDKITIQTSESEELIYSVYKEDHSYDLKFSRIGRSKIPGGIKSLLAETKTFKGRAAANKPAKGMNVEEAPSHAVN